MVCVSAQAAHGAGVIAACGPPGGGRNALTPRYVRHHTVVAMTQPSQDAMKRIFGAIVGGALSLNGIADIVALAKPVNPLDSNPRMTALPNIGEPVALRVPRNSTRLLFEFLYPFLSLLQKASAQCTMLAVTKVVPHAELVCSLNIFRNAGGLRLFVYRPLSRRPSNKQTQIVY